MEHILIITGGYLNIEFARAYIKTLSYDRVFAVDRGLEYADALGLVSAYIVGDFDTVNQSLLKDYEHRIREEKISAYIERYPAKKDASDTELAFIKALEEGAGQITVLGATGSRLDHVLANLGLLLQAERAGCKCYIVDETNRVQMLTANGRKNCSIRKEEQYGDYLSVIPMTAIVEGLTIEGVMYPLKDKTIRQGSSLTVSNQILKEAYIAIKKGDVLVIESKDK